MEKENIEQKLKQGEEVTVDVNAEDVKAFLGGRDITAPSVEQPKERIKVDRDETFNPKVKNVDNLVKDTIIDTRKVEITEQDKIAYMKAILNDVLVELPITLMNDKFTISVRARNTYEQSLIYATLRKDEKEKVIEDFPSYVTQLQRYGCTLMIKSINNEPFSNLLFEAKPNVSEDDNIELLRNAMKEKIYNLSVPKWMLLLNALLIFETKMSILAEECINKDFWNPAD